MLTTDGSLPQQLGVVWSRLLEADSEGPSFISHAACARSVSSSRTFLSCACGALPTAQRHFVNGRSLHEPYPEGTERALFGLGCFWGAERKFWQLGDGIWITAAGYAGGITPNPTYEEVCSGLTGHNEVVLVAFDPKILPYDKLLKT